MVQTIEILPQERQGLSYPAKKVSWLLLSWQHNNPAISNLDIDLAIEEYTDFSTKRVKKIP